MPWVLRQLPCLTARTPQLRGGARRGAAPGAEARASFCAKHAWRGSTDCNSLPASKHASGFPGFYEHGCRSSHRRVSAVGTRPQATKDQNDQQGLAGGLDPRLEIAVPAEQRPVNELAQIRKAVLYSWATLDTGQYFQRLSFVWLAFFILVGGPIAFQTFDPVKQPSEFLLSGALGAGFVVALAVLRIYLGWSYVGDRLLSAAVPYEETGWYDGQTFVKPPEVLARDRLLGTYEVRPALARLKSTLVGMGSGLIICAGLLFGIVATGADADGVYGRGAARAPRVVTPEGIIYSARVSNLSSLRDDDDAAAAEAEAQGGVPGYCGDRLYRAQAGGYFCSKFDYNKVHGH